MNRKQAQTAQALRKAIGRRVVADGGVALRVRYVGAGESAPDYADAVLVSATALTLSVNGTGDSTVGSSGALAFATYTTLGALVDAINLSSNWEAEIVAGLRTDAVNGSELLARSTSTFRPYVSLDLFWDSSDGGVAGIDYLLEPAGPFATAAQRAQHRVGFKRVKALVNSSGGETIQIIVYELKPDKAASQGIRFQDGAADNTAYDSGSLNEPMANADYGNSLLVRFRGTGWQDAAAYLEVQGTLE